MRLPGPLDELLGPLDKFLRSGRFLLFAYFGVVIAVGTVLLSLPAAWPEPGSISVLDALFTATSAACVTGLITVNTAHFTLFGKLVILSVIEAGGLGIIAFSTLYLWRPGAQISLRSRRLIRDYSVETVEHRPKHILKSILLWTLSVQALGVVALYVAFHRQGLETPYLAAVFHAVSAFCNAGFSLFPDSLEGFRAAPAVLGSVMVLVVLGGIGFVTLEDVRKRLLGRRARLTLHSRIVLGATGVFIGLGAVTYVLLVPELAPSGEGVLNALFQSVTTRTAGFNTMPQGDFPLPAQFVTLMLMLIGGAPGSTAGGLKVTTVVLVLSAAATGTDRRGQLQIARRRVAPETVRNAFAFAVKGLSLLAGAIFALLVVQRIVPGGTWSFADVVFETFSAFGTVGLSTGLTPELSAGGKLVIIATMIAGRLGLISLVMPVDRAEKRHAIDYPFGRVLIG
ncbi:MAG: TrkH family potassium uptake protein [Spirochaetaceae bacterium]